MQHWWDLGEVRRGNAANIACFIKPVITGDCRACSEVFQQWGGTWGSYTSAPFSPCLRVAPEHQEVHFCPFWPGALVSGNILQAPAVGNQTGK